MSAVDLNKLGQIIVAYVIVCVSGGILALAGYAQHIITCVKHEAVGLLVLGMIAFPIGILHGWGIWLGLFTR